MMFNLFKKNEKNQPDLAHLWQNLQLNHQPFSAWVVDAALGGGVLTLSVRLPDDIHPEHAYDVLCTHLAGRDDIVEVNLNVLTKSTRTQTMPNAESKKSTLPTVTSAMNNTAASNATPMPVETTSAPKPAPTQAGLAPHPRIHHIIAVASGKGGVGKSTTAVNLALALQQLGQQVGILDADIYGPSVPDMLGVAGVKPAVEGDQFVPIEASGLAMLSIGSLLDGESTPVAWRGIKATGALMQLYQQSNWPNLDYLIIDMPPGTGDIQLTLAQRIPVTAAIIVTTPQHIALLDAKKGVAFFEKTHIPVLGIIENMALHTCTNCGHSEAIFGQGGADEMAQAYGVPLLGQLPLAMGIRAQMDKGAPSVVVEDDYAVHYLAIARQVMDGIGQFAKVRSDGRIF